MNVSVDKCILISGFLAFLEVKAINEGEIKQKPAESNYVEQITLLEIQLDIHSGHNSLQTGVNTQ